MEQGAPGPSQAIADLLLALCTFPLAMCDSVMLIDVLMRHRYALIRQEDCDTCSSCGYSKCG